MKQLLARLSTSPVLSTLGAYALGIYLIRSGNVIEGATLITGAQASLNIGENLGSKQPAEK